MPLYLYLLEHGKGGEGRGREGHIKKLKVDEQVIKCPLRGTEEFLQMSTTQVLKDYKMTQWVIQQTKRGLQKMKLYTLSKCYYILKHWLAFS